MLILRNPQGQVWLEPRPPQGIWGGLWCFPQIEHDDELPRTLHQRALRADQPGQPLAGFRHTFSHFHLDIAAHEIPVASQGVADQQGRWVDPTAPGELGLAAPVKKLLNRLSGPRQASML